MTVDRSQFAGVLDIVRFNTRFYAAGLFGVVCLAALLWLRILPRAGVAVLLCVALPIAFWSVSSLAVSYYVYDYAGVTRWQWLPGVLSFSPRRWLNIHAGLDQSTTVLAHLLPGTEYAAVDIYDAREMTEPSIARARQLHPSAHPALVGKLDALPQPDRSRDTLFLLFAAHEVRASARRIQLFAEAARVVSTSGQVLVVEHMRDWRNFVAFGPGFLHFFSRSTWLHTAHSAGFTVQREGRVTPFVRYFLMSRSAV